MASVSPAHDPHCARVGIARLNNFRLNVYEKTVPIWIDGAPLPGGAGVGLLIEGATIVHALNEQVDTAAFTARGWTPVAGQRIDVYSGESTAARQLFGGRIVETSSRYLSKAATPNIVTDFNCIDPSWLLTRHVVRGTYVGLSASVIVHDIMGNFTRGFTATNVQAGLPVIDAISFINEDMPSCLSRVAKAIGAYWFVDYQNDLHFFTVADKAATGITQAAAGDAADFKLTEDLSQVATRIIGIGGGVGASVDLPAGATEIPIDLGVATGAQWYPPSGIVQVGSQRVTYGALRGITGRGSILGTGNAPTVAPGLAPTSGAGMATGTYQYAITFGTASGETLIGPAAVVQTGQPLPTVQAMSVRQSSWALLSSDMDNYTPNANYAWRAAILYVNGTWSIGPYVTVANLGNKLPEVYLGYPRTDPITGYEYPNGLMSSAPMRISQIQIYRSMPNGSGGSPTYIWWSVGVGGSSNGWFTVQAVTEENNLPFQMPYPTAAGAGENRVTVTLPISSSPSVNTRRLYRTAVNGSALKFIAGIWENTSTTWVDSNPDSALGIAPPTTDTSLLREDGQIVPGAVNILVTDNTPFVEDGGISGGWALVGNLTVRYGGISGQFLTGIPATGTGSITATVRYGAQVLVHPRLIGIPASGDGALTVGVRKGDSILLRLELADTAAALAFAQRLGSSDASLGLIDFVVEDSKAGPTELLAKMRATLAERKDPTLTLSYWTRDETHDVGRLVTVNLTTPPIVGTFRIQRVTFSEIAIAGARTMKLPKRTIEASNKLYTFADLLRRVMGG